MFVSYMLIGLGVYLGAAASNASSFKDATKVSIAVGVLYGILVWPHALYQMFSDSLSTKE